MLHFLSTSAVNRNVLHCTTKRRNRHIIIKYNLAVNTVTRNIYDIKTRYVNKQHMKETINTSLIKLWIKQRLLTNVQTCWATELYNEFCYLKDSPLSQSTYILPSLVNLAHDKYHHPSSVAPQNYKWVLASSRYFFLGRFSKNFFLQGEVVSLTPNPQPGGPGLRIYNPPPRQGCTAIPPDTG
jgi:hypothetical protein